MIIIPLSSLADDLDALEPTPVPRVSELSDSQPRAPIEIRVAGKAIAPPGPPREPNYRAYTSLTNVELGRRYRIAQVQRTQFRRERDVWKERWLAIRDELQRTQEEMRRLEGLLGL